MKYTPLLTTKYYTYFSYLKIFSNIIIQFGFYTKFFCITSMTFLGFQPEVICSAQQSSYSYGI